MFEHITSAIAAHARRTQLPEPALRRILRTRVGLTQMDVAETVGVCPPTVSRWESGATPRGSTLDRYVELLAFLATTESNAPPKCTTPLAGGVGRKRQESAAMTKRNRAPIGSLSHDLDGGSRSSAGTGNSTIRPEQRFTKRRPCPICGGHGGLRRGAGERCYGFLSDDGEWAHCTRETHSRGLEWNQKSRTYAHRLAAGCRCGWDHTASAPPSASATPNESPEASPRWNARYRYEDESGQLLFEVRRSSEKDFAVFSPSPGGLSPGLRGSKVLYGLPAVKAAIAAGEMVFIVEGEKDVDTLVSLGLTATCNPFGAGKFYTDYAASLTNATVVIIPDSDAAGRDHAQDVAQKLVGVADEIRILDLGTHREDGYDVSDFCAAATTPEELKKARDALVASAASAPEFDSTDKGSPVVKRNSATGHGSLQFTPLPDLIANVPPEPEWIFDGYVAPESITLVAERPKVGKTTLVFGLLRAITLGDAFLGRSTRKTGALILTE